jgi:hypothetical protein
MEDFKTLFCSSKIPWTCDNISLKFVTIWARNLKRFVSPRLGYVFYQVILQLESSVTLMCARQIS